MSEMYFSRLKECVNGISLDGPECVADKRSETNTLCGSGRCTIATAHPPADSARECICLPCTSGTVRKPYPVYKDVSHKHGFLVAHSRISILMWFRI